VALRATVNASVSANLSLRETYERAVAALRPRYGEWAIFGHALPFDVSRAYDEARGIDSPVPWTAERDKEIWAVLHG
jgi:hypothetical protein